MNQSNERNNFGDENVEEVDNNQNPSDSSETTGTLNGAVAGAMIGAPFGLVGAVIGGVSGGAIGNQMVEGTEADDQSDFESRDGNNLNDSLKE
ncbi:MULTISPECIES: glycine zipper family protein [Robertmurraya]|uniref:Glycine zipper family protein n=1 Tax=Robertmurraya beringensis TaxID=641660 RepID=A0ABV6KW50_9BACI|nr:proteobacterial sortase system OmpA family protein [Mycobacteroides abscessus subsp. abscessus]